MKTMLCAVLLNPQKLTFSKGYTPTLKFTATLSDHTSHTALAVARYSASSSSTTQVLFRGNM
jgi:hypothetical protein